MDWQGGSAAAQHSVDERLPLALLTVRRGVIERVVDGRDLPRFSRLCKPGGDIRVRLAFGTGESGGTRIEGELGGTFSIDCHRCLEAVSVKSTTRFSVVAVTDESAAARLGPKQDVLLLTSDEPTLAELIEDELILALPDRPCGKEHCDKAPPVAYPREAPDEENPFRSLALLKES